MPDLAVIMSVYQNDKLEYLEKSVQSILTQTYSQFDFLIAFDGPVSLEIDKYISSLIDNRIRIYRLENNEGLANALNYLLKIVISDSRYKLIARMDADDISMPERFKKQHNFFSTNPDISCIGTWYQEIDKTGKHLSDRKLPVDHDGIKKLYYLRTPFAHPSVMFRREMIDKAGLYPINTLKLEDYVLWGNALMKGFKLANIPEFLLKFRIDRDFYKRRSGLKYGTSFIQTRFKILISLKAPIHIYFFTLMIGIVKMLPIFLVKSIYRGHRKIFFCIPVY